MLRAIETTLIGNSDLRVSRVGFGCWQLGGYGWQNTSQNEIKNAINLALDLGINFFDTADIYGLGASEILLAKTISQHPLGNTAIISSKFGVRNGRDGTYIDNSKEWLSEAIDGSLRRLRRDSIDLYQLHWPDNKRPILETLEDLEALRAQGKIRWYGISNLPPSVLDVAKNLNGLASFTMEYSLVRRNNEKEILQTLKNEKLSFIAWAALSQGLLTGKYDRNSDFSDNDIRKRPNSLFLNANWDYYDAVLKKLREISKKNEKKISQVALRFILDYFPNSIVLTGIKNIFQLQENFDALGWSLSEEDFRDLQNISAKTYEKST